MSQQLHWTRRIWATVKTRSEGVCVFVSRASSLKRRCRPYKGTLTSPEGGGGAFVRTGRREHECESSVSHGSYTPHPP